MSTKPLAATTPTEKQLYKKWTKPLIDAGYTVMPTIIVQRMRVLGLSPVEFAIVMQLASYWWQPENAPHPSVKTIASAMGVAESTVKRGIKALVAAKFLNKQSRPQAGNRHKSNLYDLRPLIDAVTPYALEELKNIEERKEKKKKSLTKKGKPHLAVAK